MERKIEDIILDEINEVLQHFLMHAELETATGKTLATYRYIVPVDVDQYDDPDKAIEFAMDSIKLNMEESCNKIANRFELTEVSVGSVSSPDGSEIQINITGNIKD